ncbi:MAG TPA: tetratricopeptide repeat protein [Verrucomicrobiae bacterium]|nr:tetratricopeptide repeat protein [Verrucomicrobiae bacterium]
MWRFVCVASLLLHAAVFGAEPRAKTVAEIADKARNSVVVITQRARDGSVEGVGSGFVVSRNGLIATSLHVIGEGRPIEIRFADGKKYSATEVHAWDRKLDLAVIRIGESNLPALKLGESSEVKQGASVVAMGNPRGLTHSVVQGVVSAFREFESGRMIQLAIPIEPGNSGGPLLDANGRVIGILEMKSAVTENLGFATPVDALKTLLDKPNPVPAERWITLGALDPRKWKPVYGASWTRRAGEIRVSGAGTGFGGRSLCFYQPAPPALPYEVSVTVKLDDEAGAAGLIFAADGGDQHYGFYPSAGQLRLTRFDGPDVFTWKILEQKPSAHYRPGEWNNIRVRVEKDSIRCFVNDELAIESKDTAVRNGGVGLAKFRQTQAQFRNFEVRSVKDKADPKTEDARANLLAEARQREMQAADLRKRADDLHLTEVRDALVAELKNADAKIDLFKCALLVARLDNPDLDIEPYRAEVADMAAEISRSIPNDATAATKLDRLIAFLFRENGYHGSRSDYYNRANSYINEVIDDREGIPLTLSILFIELAERIGIKGVAGVPLPGHFMVQFAPRGENAKYIDVFEGGRTGDRAQANEWAQSHSEVPIFEEHFRAATKKEMIVRMLRNLIGLSNPAESPAQALRYLELVTAITPEDPADHWRRAVLRYQVGNVDGAKEDLQWLIDKQPEGVNMERVQELYRSLQ